MTKKKIAKPALFLTAMIWGSTFAVAKLATEAFSASFINAFRFTTAAVVLMIAAYPLRKMIDKTYMVYGFLMGVTLFGGYIMQTIGLTMDTSPGKSAFLSTTYCVVVPFLYWIVTKETPRLLHIFCILLCVTGVGVLSLQGSMGMSGGDLMTVASGIPTAANIVVSSVACKDRHPLLLTLIELWTVAVLAWIMVLATGSFPEAFPIGAVGGIIYLGVFATALCLFLQSFGLKYAQASVGGMILSLEAVFGVIFSIILYHEKVTGRMIIGFVIIFAAIILSQREPKEK